MRRVYRGRKKIGGRGGGLAVHQKGSESESEEPPYCTPSPIEQALQKAAGSAVELGLAVTPG